MAADEAEATRARFWRRAFANLIDALAIGGALAALGLILFALTDGLVRVTSIPLSVRNCSQLSALPAGVSLPTDFKVTHAARCTFQFLGYPYNRFIVLIEATPLGAGTATRNITFAIDADGQPMRAFYLDYLGFLLLAVHLLLLEWRLGKTLGKDLLDMRIRSLGGGPLTFIQAAKRLLVRAIPWLTMAPVLILMWIGPESFFARIHYVWITMAASVTAALILLLNFIFTTRRGNLPWHDRWAGTEVVRGR